MEMLGGIALFFLPVVIAVIIGLVFAWIKLARDAENRPEGARRQELLVQVEHMRRQQMPYKDRLAFLREQGLRKDVADELLGENIRNGT
ncbi:MAG: hypothetical protein ACLFPX_06890 [Candidatus Omnitrophota bacterium]